ncbi:hypothetical protein ACTHSI_27430, partial [Neisseria sp. P0001.S004]
MYKEVLRLHKQKPLNNNKIIKKSKSLQFHNNKHKKKQTQSKTIQKIILKYKKNIQRITYKRRTK